MEQLLIKLARQLDSLDESSLMTLWEKYAAIVAKFEPSQRWEEAALILSFIQAKRWKNQLFNYHWARQVQLSQEPQAEGQTDPPGTRPRDAFQLDRPQSSVPDNGAEQKRCQVLRFRSVQDD